MTAGGGACCLSVSLKSTELKRAQTGYVFLRLWFLSICRVECRVPFRAIVTGNPTCSKYLVTSLPARSQHDVEWGKLELPSCTGRNSNEGIQREVTICLVSGPVPAAFGCFATRLRRLACLQWTVPGRLLMFRLGTPVTTATTLPVATRASQRCTMDMHEDWCCMLDTQVSSQVAIETVRAVRSTRCNYRA